jgi:hypothetical protein
MKTLIGMITLLAVVVVGGLAAYDYNTGHLGLVPTSLGCDSCGSCCDEVAPCCSEPAPCSLGVATPEGDCAAACPAAAEKSAAAEDAPCCSKAKAEAPAPASAAAPAGK